MTVKRIFPVLLFGVLGISCRNNNLTVIKHEYMGMDAPGGKAVLFAPGLVSTGEFAEYGGGFSSNLQEFHFFRDVPGSVRQVNVMHWVGSGWSDPAEANNSDRYGNRAHLLASAAADDPSAFGRGFAYASRIRAAGQNYLRPLEQPDAGREGEAEICFAARKDGGDSDIWYALKDKTGYTDPISLGDAVNSEADEVTADMSPDGTFIVFSSNRAGGMGGYDLYASRRSPDGRWLPAVNLGRTVNTKADELYPHVMPNGAYLLFTKAAEDDADIFWIDIAAIASLVFSGI